MNKRQICELKTVGGTCGCSVKEWVPIDLQSCCRNCRNADPEQLYGPICEIIGERIPYDSFCCIEWRSKDERDEIFNM